MLSICIPTVPQRRSLLSRLLFTLQHQIGDCGEVEVLVADGDWPLGDKANTMFAAAKGHFVVVIDDDDNVSADYVRMICSVDREWHDMIGYFLLWTEEGRYMGIPLHWGGGDPADDVHNRGACPKTPIRREIALRHEFPNDYFGDNAWSKAVHAEIESYATIYRPMYHYDHWNNQMIGTDLAGQQAGWYSRPQRDVGLWPYTATNFRWITSPG